MDEIKTREMSYKIESIIEYLKKNSGNEYQLMNKNSEEADSNIVEYAEDIKEFIQYQSNLKICDCDDNEIF